MTLLDGSCSLSIAGLAPITLESGDFVLVPAAYDFVTSSLEPPSPGVEPQRVETGPSVFRIGAQDVAPTVRMLVGHCSFGSEDADLLMSLLPRFIQADAASDSLGDSHHVGIVIR